MTCPMLARKDIAIADDNAVKARSVKVDEPCSLRAGRATPSFHITKTET